MTRFDAEGRAHNIERFDVWVDVRSVSQQIMRVLRGETHREGLRLAEALIYDVLIRTITVSALITSATNLIKLDALIELGPTLVERADSKEIPEVIKQLAELWVGRAEITPTANGYHLLIRGPKTPIHIEFKIWNLGSDSPPGNLIEIATDDLEINPDKQGSRELIASVIEEYAEILSQLIEALYNTLHITPILGGKELQLKITSDDHDEEEYAFD